MIGIHNSGYVNSVAQTAASETTGVPSTRVPEDEGMNDFTAGRSWSPSVAIPIACIPPSSSLSLHVLT